MSAISFTIDSVEAGESYVTWCCCAMILALSIRTLASDEIPAETVIMWSSISLILLAEFSTTSLSLCRLSEIMTTPFLHTIPIDALPSLIVFSAYSTCNMCPSGANIVAARS